MQSANLQILDIVDIQPLFHRLLDVNNSKNALDFERKWMEDSYAPFLAWMQRNWSLTVLYSVVYVCLALGGRYYMEKRERFDLRVPLIMWSSVLAMFSIFGTMRTLPELVLILKEQGLAASICDPSYYHNPTTNFWGALFVLSKVWELGDTFFIVMRKQPLIFLHWYHHVTVMIYCFHAYAFQNAAGRWFMNMNYVIHSLMYSYYALRAMRMRVPRAVSVTLTTLQIAQMLMGIFVLAYGYRLAHSGFACSINQPALVYGFLMYVSYAVLFLNFFCRTYLAPAARPKAD